MATTTTTAAAATTSCATGLWNFQSSSVEPQVPPSSNHVSPPSSGKLDGVAMWLINGVATAFFASLEKCSCVRVTTVEDVDDMNELPLIYNDGNSSNGLRSRAGRGKKGGLYS
ncbi:hypothetical protein Ancab_016586 [Ancistrocladus abbreviatus]